MRTAVAAAVVLIAGLAASPADAQVTVGAAVGQSLQAEGTSDSPYLGPGFGGWSLAYIGMIDVAASSRVSLGGEISFAGDISGNQRQRVSAGTNVLLSDHHDTVFSLLAKIGTPDDRRVRVRAVIGGGVAQRHTERLGTLEPFNTMTPPLKHPPSLEVLSDSVPALTGGLDVSAGIGSRIAIVALVRLYQLKDDDRLPEGVVRRGVSSTIVRYGGGLQLRF
jgi:hypothetical protein